VWDKVQTRPSRLFAAARLPEEIKNPAQSFANRSASPALKGLSEERVRRIVREELRKRA